MRTDVRQYLATCLWSTNDESDERGGNPLDDNFGPDDFDAKSIAQAETDINTFLVACRNKAASLGEDCLDRLNEALAMSLDGPDLFAHDLWLNRNGHGCGFWDGDYDQFGEDVVEILDTCAKALGETGAWADFDNHIVHLGY